MGGLHEHSVMLASDLLERVAESLQEIVVRGENRTVELELDDRLRLAHGAQLTGEIGSTQLLGGDIRRKLDHLVGLPRGVEHGIVTCLNPDLFAASTESFVLTAVVLAVTEFAPEQAVVAAIAMG